MPFRKIRKEKSEQRSHLSRRHLYDPGTRSDLHNTGPERHYSDHRDTQCHCFFRGIQSSGRDVLHSSVKSPEHDPCKDHPGPQVIQHITHPSPTYILLRFQKAPVLLPGQPHETLSVKMPLPFLLPIPSSAPGIPHIRCSISDNFPESL